MAKVALIEDDLGIIEMYKLKFESSPHELSVATDGDSGLALVKKEKPDLVLLDILMPKKNGFEIVKEMREDPELAKTKIIMLTNLGDDETQKQFKSLGVKDYIIKADLTPKEVLEKVERLLKK